MCIALWNLNITSAKNNDNNTSELNTKEQNTNTTTNEEICSRITKQYNTKEQVQIRYDEKSTKLRRLSNKRQHGKQHNVHVRISVIE